VLPNGNPVAGARVTVDDGWGIPHMTVLTSSDGSFSVVLPPGNDTVNVTIGTFNALHQQDAVVLKSIPISIPNAVGMSLNAPALVQSVTVAPATAQGFVYWNANNTTGFVASQDPLIPGAQVVFWGSGLAPVRATTDASGSFYLPNLAPGVYDYNILYAGRNYTQSPVTLTPGSPINATIGLLPGVFRGIVTDSTGSPVVDSTVTLGNASGIVASTVSNATGAYLIRSVGAGTYTLTAQGPTADLRSEGILVTAASPGAGVRTNLTVRPTASVAITVTANGTPVSGIPVRLVPVAAYGNRSPIGALENASQNGTVVTTGADGQAVALLPSGTYSVYGVGYVGTTVYAGVGTLTVPTTGVALSLTLPLSPGLRLSGNVASSGPSSNSTGTAVIAYAPSGGEVVAWAGTVGNFSLLLPSGTYSVLALSGPANASASSVSSALTSVILTQPTRLALAPVSALYSQFTVGSTLASGALLPADGAQVTVSSGPEGPSVPAVASASGVVTFYLPSVLSGSGPSYCIGSSALGFAPASQCGISPSGLSALTKFPLTLENVAVTLKVVGLPSGTSVVVNLTAESPSAVNRTLSGGPNFAFSAPPGIYGVGAWASLGNGTLYLPPSTLSTTVPLGATYTNLTLYLLPWVASKGTLTLPAGAATSAVNLTLTSPALTLTLNGTHFTKGFRAAPGTYSAYANVTVANVTYANLTQLTVSPSGKVSPAISLAGTGLKVAGRLTDTAGASTTLNATVTLTSPSGAVVHAVATNGVFSTVLPGGIAYRLQANATSSTAGPNGSFFESWTSSPGASCTPTAAVPQCALPMVPTTDLLWLNGTLSTSGISGGVGGALRLVGPYPSDNVTLVGAPNGAFSLRVLPGAYSVYANATSLGSLRAAFASSLVLPSNEVPLALSLVPTRSVTITLAPPNGTTAGLGPVSLALRDAAGNRLLYSGLRGTSSLTVALPVGTYSVSALAPGTSYGVATNATASATFAVANGNVGVLLTLAYQPQYRVAASLTGPTVATVAGGGVATFAFALRDSGNVPVTVTPVGTPAYWTFDFSLASVTLTPGGPNASGEVRILVPAGTAVSHPAVTLEFKLANGTVVGSVAPQVQVIAYYGVRTGAPTAPVQVAPRQVVVPFYVANTGNTFERAALSIVDAPRLEGLGWSPIVLNSSRAVTPVASLAPGTNETFFVYLNATGPAFIAPGTVTVSASVLDANGSVQASAVLAVAPATVAAKAPPGGSAVTVNGPGLGSAPFTLPDWLIALLAFVPAIALAVGVVTYRWWRTRRWNRR
jgi:hypothetical protein